MVVTRKRPSGLTVAPRCELLPFEPFRRRLRRIRKPQRRPVVVRDREPKALWQKGEAADGRGCLEFAQVLRLREGRLAGRPGDGAVRAERDVIDPAPLRVSGERAALAYGIRLHHFAIVAAADDTRTVGRRRKDRASVHGNAPRVALRLDHQQRLIAEHEHRRAAEKMRGDHRRLGGDVARAFGEGDGVVAALRHGALRNGKGWCRTRSGNSWAAAPGGGARQGRG